MRKPVPNRGGPWKWHPNGHDREWRGRDNRGTPSWHQYWCRLFVDGRWCDCTDPPGPPQYGPIGDAGGTAEKPAKRVIEEEAEDA